MSYYAKRGNKILRINEDAVAQYVVRGYTITDKNGKVVKQGVPTDVNQLTASYKSHQSEISELKSENAKLKEELKAVKAELDKFKSMPISAEPKPTRKRKQTTEDTVVSEE